MKQKTNAINLTTIVGMVTLATLVSPVRAEFDHYCDWKLDIFRVPSTQDGDDVRLHFDMTQAMHGPWLSNPGVDSMSVAFQSRCNCGAAIEYREKGTEKWTRQWRTVYGMVDYADDLHFFHLKNLKPATVYEYRFVAASDRRQNAYTDPVVGRETWTFKTLDPARRDFKVFVTTDVHGTCRLTLDYMYERSGAKDADIFFFLGDNVEDCMAQSDFYVTTGFLDYVVNLWGKERPSVFLRGNHDCSGYDAVNACARWYERPDGKGYYTVRHGNALFVIFDIPHPGEKMKANVEARDEYIRGEREWFRELKKTAEWRETTWRVTMCHYGTRCASAFVDKWCFRDNFADLLNGDDGTEPVDLHLCGDAHFYLRNLAHSKEYFHNAKYDKPGKKPYVFKPCKTADPDKDWRFAEVCNKNSTAASTLEIGEKTLRYVNYDIYPATPQPPMDEFTLTK